MVSSPPLVGLSPPIPVNFAALTAFVVSTIFTCVYLAVAVGCHRRFYFPTNRKTRPVHTRLDLALPNRAVPQRSVPFPIQPQLTSPAITARSTPCLSHPDLATTLDYQTPPLPAEPAFRPVPYQSIAHRTRPSRSEPNTAFPLSAGHLPAQPGQTSPVFRPVPYLALPNATVALHARTDASTPLLTKPVLSAPCQTGPKACALPYLTEPHRTGHNQTISNHTALPKGKPVIFTCQTLFLRLRIGHEATKADMREVPMDLVSEARATAPSLPEVQMR